MAKIFSAKAELTVLRGLFHKDRAVVGALLASIDESYFYREEGVEVYERVKDSMSEDGKIPKYRVMLEDPDLSEDARQYLRESQALIDSVSDAKKSVTILNKYRRRRGLHNIAHRIDLALQEGHSNLSELEEEVSNALTQVKATKSSKDAFLSYGKNSNSREFVKSFLRDPVNDNVIPTGIAPFDDVNGGFFRGSLGLISGNSGSGKSMVAVAIAKYMASIGYKVVLVPLEMSKIEITSRLIANVTKTDSLRLLRKTLSKEEVNRVERKFDKWNRRTKSRGGRLTIFKPDYDIGIEEVYASLSSFTADVTIVDYVSLLSGIDSDDQWRKLGAIARYAKINAELNDRVNLLLAQVNDEGRLKYSQTMKEHASNMWSFVATNETKEQGILKVEQPKSRNQDHFPFNVQIEYQYSRVHGIENDYRPDDQKKDRAKNLAADSDI